MIRYADVLLPLPLEEPFTYSVPPPLAERVQPGMRVLVPFGGKLLTGFVLRTAARTRKKGMTLKPVAEVLDDQPSFPASFLAFTEKLSRYFFIPWGEILQASLPPSLLVRTKATYFLSQKGAQALENGVLRPGEEAVALWLKKKAYSGRFLERKLGLKNIASLLSRMERKGLIAVKRGVRREKRRKKRKAPFRPVQLELHFSLEKSVEQAGHRIQAVLAENRFSPFLVVGSREKRQALYLELIRRVRREVGGVLYLVPEIALASDIVSRIRHSLGEEVGLFHSQLPTPQRELEWQKAREGLVRVALGARSALFSPLEEVKLIILDEEHDDSYDQGDGSPFDIRKGAWLRAKEEGATLVMGSAMPTVEAYYRAQKEGHLINLGGEEWTKRVTLVDSRKDHGLVSRLLLEKMEEKLRTGEPILLFFNRRGYAAYFICAKCGFIPRCPRCRQALAYHRKEEKLACHSCRLLFPQPPGCSRCGSRLLEKRGPGIEAVGEELKKAFPQRRIEVLSADAPSSKGRRETILGDFRKGRVDILLGTRFLIRQPDLPAAGLVGILHPEMLLHLADFRSSQRAFQTVMSFLRFVKPSPSGEAIIQTGAPEHFAIATAARGDYRAFYEQEIKFRRLMGYPPFSCLAEVILEGKNSRRLAAQARDFVKKIKEATPTVEIFGPSLGFSASGKSTPRIKIGLKAKRKQSLDRLLSRVWPTVPLRKRASFFD